MEAMGEKGLSSIFIMAIVIAAAVVAIGGYFIVTRGGGGTQGLRASDLNPKVGDKWQFRTTIGDWLTFSVNLEVKSTENRLLGEFVHEVRVIEGRGNVKRWDGVEEPPPIVSSSVRTTSFLGEDGISHEDNVEISAVEISYSNEEDKLHLVMDNVSELISGKEPDIVRVGDNWSTTQRLTGTLAANGTSQSSEGIYTVDFECIGTQKVTVQAGTFYCYVVRQTVVGVEGYSLYYYSSKTKLPVKSVVYLNGNITSLTELLSYNVR